MNRKAGQNLEMRINSGIKRLGNFKGIIPMITLIVGVRIVRQSKGFQKVYESSEIPTIPWTTATQLKKE